MAGTVTKSLYLQIGGDVTALNTAAKAGKSVLLSLGDAAVDVEAEVKRAFADFGSSIPDQAKQIERSFADTFAAIRRNAQSVLDAPDGHAAVQVLNAGAADQAAAAAEKQAVALRQVATAASTVADRAGAAGAAERVLAVAAAAVAERAEEEATALRNQATLLGTVDAEIRAAAGGVEDAGSKVVDAHSRMGASGAILQHVVRSTTDSFAAGLPVSIIFAEQVGRLGEAAALSEGSFGKFGAIMSGPWGLAITVAISLAAQLVGKLAEGNDKVGEAVEKLKEDAQQTDAARQAKDRFARSVEGVTAAIHDQLDAQKKAIENERSEAENANINARAQLAKAVAIREATKALLEQAIAAEKSSHGANLAVAGGASNQTAGIYGQRVADLQQQLAQADQRTADAQRVYDNSRVDLASEQAKSAADPIKRINDLYDDQERSARNAARGNKALTDSLGALIVSLEAMRKKAIEAEQARQSAEKKSADTHQIGREVTLSQAEDIVHSIGGRVTSGFRSTAKQAELYARYQAGEGPLAAKPGTSLHESGQALDVAKSVGVTLGTLKKAFTDAGVHLTELLDEGDHYHVGFGKKGPSADALARRQQAQVVKGANDDRAFTNADRQLDDAIAKAKQQLSGSIEDDYQLKVAQIAADADAKNHAIQDQVVAGKLTQAQADQLKLKTDEVAILDQQIASEQRRVQLANAAFQVDSDASTGRLALLQLDASLATTRRGRLDAERKILDEEQAQARRAAQNAVDVAAPGSTEQKTALAAQARLPALQAGQDREFNDQHLDALASYKKQLHSDTEDMNDALKGVAADGLKGIEDGFVGIISGTETVSQAFSRMAESILSDLARIAIEKAIVSVLGFSEGGQVGSITPETHAGGGMISGKGSGTSDDILSWLSNGEFVMTAAATRKHLPMLKAMNDNKLPAFATGGLVGGLPSLPTSYPTLPRAEQLRAPAGGGQPLHIDMRGAVMTQDLLHQMQQLAVQSGGVAYQGAVAHTNQQIAGLRRPSL